MFIALFVIALLAAMVLGGLSALYRSELNIHKKMVAERDVLLANAQTINAQLQAFVNKHQRKGKITRHGGVR